MGSRCLDMCGFAARLLLLHFQKLVFDIFRHEMLWWVWGGRVRCRTNKLMDASSTHRKLSAMKSSVGDLKMCFRGVHVHSFCRHGFPGGLFCDAWGSLGYVGVSHSI